MQQAAPQKAAAIQKAQNSAMCHSIWNTAGAVHTKTNAIQILKRQSLHLSHCRMHQTERKPSGTCRQRDLAAMRKSVTELGQSLQTSAGTTIWKNCLREAEREIFLRKQNSSIKL